MSNADNDRLLGKRINPAKTPVHQTSDEKKEPRGDKNRSEYTGDTEAGNEDKGAKL